jgi:hypothetical protein
MSAHTREEPMMITNEDWLTAVSDAANQPLPASDAMTLAELSKLLGMGRAAATKRINTLIARGDAVRSRKLIERTDGVRVRVSAYRLVKKESPAAPSDRGVARGEGGRHGHSAPTRKNARRH